MGGDHGPSVAVTAAARALKDLPPHARVLLNGDEAQVQAELSKHDALVARAAVRHAERVIGMDEKPAQALRRGKGTSMWNAVEAIREGEAQVAISAGNTGALMAISKLILRMSADLDRPALVASIPHEKGVTTFLDVGANVDCDAERLVEFAIMGEAYHRAAHGVPRPTVGLLNVGSEDMKGHQEVREAHRVLREGHFDLDYRGFVEGDDITKGSVDVVVTDGFTGNVALKTLEGGMKGLVNRLFEAFGANDETRAAADVLMPELLPLYATLDPENTGGAMLLGVDGVCIISHGSSGPTAVVNAVRVARDMVAGDVPGHLAAAVA